MRGGRASGGGDNGRRGARVAAGLRAEATTAGRGRAGRVSISPVAGEREGRGRRRGSLAAGPRAEGTTAGRGRAGRVASISPVAGEREGRGWRRGSLAAGVEGGASGRE